MKKVIENDFESLGYVTLQKPIEALNMVYPNKNLKEWKDLESSVGEFEAYKDFLETGGDIRTPEEVTSTTEGRTLRAVWTVVWAALVGVGMSIRSARVSIMGGGGAPTLRGGDLSAVACGPYVAESGTN